MITLTEEQFEERYTLLVNHLSPNASWAYDDQNGCLFETYGDELQFVRAQISHNRVWSFIEGDDGLQVVYGFHHVNVIGYLISEQSIPEGVDIQVIIDEE